MLLQLPIIILSSNSFYFNLLAIPKIIPSTKHPTKSLIYKAMLKITIYILPIKEVHTKSVVSQLAKGIFSE